MGTANELTGSVFSQYNKVEDYFNLKKENERLNKENSRLINLVKDNYSSPDTINKVSLEYGRICQMFKSLNFSARGTG